MERNGPAPFLRWAGSKRWLVPTLRGLPAVSFGTYYEPFLGSGAAYFALAVGRPAELSDILTPLVNCYQQIRFDPQLVGKLASSWDTDASTYYEVRAISYEDDPVRQAAQFLYLNRLCFNALYRENRAGKFNVPYGRPRPTNVVVDQSNLDQVSDALNAGRTNITVRDFETALDLAQLNDLAFVDPPYALSKRRQPFAEYTSTLFSWDDQVRLAATLRRAAKRGCRIISTNTDHPRIRDLYDGFSLRPVSRFSSMSAGADGRKASSELLITVGVDLDGPAR